MIRIKVDDTVRVRSYGHDRIGKVIRTYDLLEPIAIVEFDDGTVKIPVKDLEKVEPQVNREIKPEIPEGAKEITVDEFMDAINKVTDPKRIIEMVGVEKGLLVGMAALMSAIKLGDKLFKDSEAIVITKDQLIREIIDSALDEDPKFLAVAFVNGIILKGIVDVIFTDGSEECK